MNHTTLLCQNSYLQSYSEEAPFQDASTADPNEPLTDSYYPSNVSHTCPSFESMSFYVNHEIHSPAADWGINAMRMHPEAGPIQIDGLRWNQHYDSTCPPFDAYPAQSEWSAFDARSNNTISSSALPTGENSDSLLGLRNYEQSAYDRRHYGTTIDHALFTPPCPASLMSLDDSTHLLDHTGSHLRLDFEASSHPPPNQHDIDLDFSCLTNGTAIDLDSGSNVAYEPEIGSPNGTSTRLSCHHHGCEVQFNNVADRKRHLKTIHNEAGQSYMCAYVGCVRAYKVWNRLDSFKNHAKLHKPNDMEALVKKSRKQRDGLRVAVTTQKKLSQCRPNELGSHLSSSHEYY